MSVIAIMGLQWGDEGKGKIVDLLSEQAQHVARFQGGHNAGHTIFSEGKKYIFHLLPSGVLHSHSSCYIGTGVVISPSALLAEIEQVKAQGVDLKGRLFIASNASLLLPYHQLLDQAREKQNNIGTTLRGIGPAHEDKIGRRAIRFYDIINGTEKSRFEANVEYYNYLLARHNGEQINSEILWQTILTEVERLSPYLCEDISFRLATAQKRNENILLEGAQGALLDVEQGTYPYATSASCIAGAAASGLGIDLHPSVIGVIKAYTTRVGNGPFPTEINDIDGQKLSTEGQEFGSTTGRARRCGWLDIPLLRHALQINGCKRLIITKTDVLDNFNEIKLCTAYKMNNRVIDFPPTNMALLSQCQPIYESFSAWNTPYQMTAEVSEYNLFSENKKNFFKKIESLCGEEVKIDMISTGRSRESVVSRSSLF